MLDTRLTSGAVRLNFLSPIPRSPHHEAGMRLPGAQNVTRLMPVGNQDRLALKPNRCARAQDLLKVTAKKSDELVRIRGGSC